MLGDTSYRGLDIAGLQRFDNGWMRPRNVRKVDILVGLTSPTDALATDALAARST